MPWIVVTTGFCPHCVRWRSLYESKLAKLSPADRAKIENAVIVADAEKDAATVRHLQVTSVPAVFDADSGRPIPLNAFLFLDELFRIVLGHAAPARAQSHGSPLADTPAATTSTLHLLVGAGVLLWLLTG
jgi:glutaredoxin